MRTETVKLTIERKGRWNRIKSGEEIKGIEKSRKWTI